MDVIVDVGVIVIDPVIVAALVSGNDTVEVIDPVNARGFELLGRIAPMPMKLNDLDVHGVDHLHGVVPAHERGHDHGVDHAHVHVHDHVHGTRALDPDR